MPNQSLRKRLRSTPKRKGSPCAVCLIGTTDQAYLRNINNALPDKRYKDLARLVQADGYTHITHHMLENHADHVEVRRG